MTISNSVTDRRPMPLHARPCSGDDFRFAPSSWSLRVIRERKKSANSRDYYLWLLPAAIADDRTPSIATKASAIVTLKEARDRTPVRDRSMTSCERRFAPRIWISQTLGASVCDGLTRSSISKCARQWFADQLSSWSPCRFATNESGKFFLEPVM